MAGKRALLTPEEVNGAWAIIPTPAKPGAEDWRMEDTLNEDELARVIDGLIDSGIDGILSLGTLGECSTLTWDEKKRFMQVGVEATAGRVPFFVGTTTLGTRDTVAQTRYAADVGADGTMLGIPMWCAPSIENAVRFYQDVAEACPDIAIAIYANETAFKFPFPTPFWKQVADIRQVVTAKYIGVARLLHDLRAVDGKISLLPIEGEYYGAARMAPEEITGFWTPTAVCGPATTLTLRDRVIAAKASGDWSAAKVLADEMAVASHGFFPNRDVFAKYNIPLEKARMTAGGWMNAGPLRPPYLDTPEEYLAGARKVGERFGALHQKYAEEAFGKKAAAE